MEIILAIILGGLFGFALYLVGASNPKKLLSMLRLQDLSLMKIILFGIGFSSVLLSIAIALGVFNISHLSIKSTHLGVVIGGLIFGFGFGSVGTCPGTCVAATGTNGFRQAIAAVFGGFTGVFAFSMTYGFWKDTGLYNAMDLGKLTLFNISDKFPSIFEIGYFGLLIVGIFFMVFAYLLPQRGRKVKVIK
jgi:uncharacterized membrane protein YedE/YeeE